MSLFTLFEYGAVLRKSRRAGLAQDFAELVGAESREQRGNQRKDRLWSCFLGGTDSVDRI
jgi:hypothetical protein